MHLEADPAEQAALSRIRELKPEGYTTRQIAEELKPPRLHHPARDGMEVSVCGGNAEGGLRGTI